MTTIDSTSGTPSTRYIELDEKQGPPPPPPPRHDADAHIPSLPSTRFACDAMKATAPSLYPGPISPDDIQQGQVEDCTMLATLGSLARTPEGRARIRSMIEQTGPGRYSVTLYRPFGIFGYFPAKVEVSLCDVQVDDPNNLGKPALWPCIIQTAAGRLHGGTLPNTVPASSAMVLGDPAREIRTTARDLPERMVEAFRQNKAQVLVTGAVESDKAMHAHHAYAVTDVKVTENGLLVQVTNPWGNDKRWMTIAQIKADFVAYADVRPR